MFCKQLYFLICQVLGHIRCASDVYYYNPANISRSTLSGIAEYRSALTLDWLAAEDSRQRELVKAYETDPPPLGAIIATECMVYAKPASGKVGRLMLELLKNLEGDEGRIMTEMIQALVRSKLLVETSMLEAEPDLEALVKTPGVMMGEPHSTFPRILAMVWMGATDTSSVKKHGWCPLQRITKYLSITRPVEIAKTMRSIDPVISRARYLIEEFVQHVTPLNVYSDKNQFEFGKKDKKIPGFKQKQIKRLLRKTYTSTKAFTIRRKRPNTETTLGLPEQTNFEETDDNYVIRILKSDDKQGNNNVPNEVYTELSELKNVQQTNIASSNEASISLITFVFVLLITIVLY